MLDIQIFPNISASKGACTLSPQQTLNEIHTWIHGRLALPRILELLLILGSYYIRPEMSIEQHRSAEVTTMSINATVIGVNRVGRGRWLALGALVLSGLVFG